MFSQLFTKSKKVSLTPDQLFFQNTLKSELNERLLLTDMNRKNWFGKETKLEKDKLVKENANLKRKIQEMEYEIKIWKEKMKNSNEREELFQENYRSRNRERVSTGKI